jgi:hypothetical protein
METDDLASVLADKAISPATAHPMTSFFIYPPNSTHPFPSELTSIANTIVGLGI